MQTQCGRCINMGRNELLGTIRTCISSSGYSCEFGSCLRGIPYQVLCKREPRSPLQLTFCRCSSSSCVYLSLKGGVERLLMSGRTWWKLILSCVSGLARTGFPLLESPVASYSGLCKAKLDRFQGGEIPLPPIHCRGRGVGERGGGVWKCIPLHCGAEELEMQSKKKSKEKII